MINVDNKVATHTDKVPQVAFDYNTANKSKLRKFLKFLRMNFIISPKRMIG